MPKWLTQTWLDETRAMAADQPEHPGASARMQYVVTGGPDGDVRYFLVVDNGRVVESGLGSLEEPDVTLTTPYGEAKAVQLGELDPNTAFMQGKVKVAGDMARVMALLPIINSPEYRQLQSEIREITEY